MCGAASRVHANVSPEPKVSRKHSRARKQVGGSEVKNEAIHGRAKLSLTALRGLRRLQES